MTKKKEETTHTESKEIHTATPGLHYRKITEDCIFELSVRDSDSSKAYNTLRKVLDNEATPNKKEKLGYHG